MHQKIETMIRNYPQKKMELECLRHQLQNFQGISETDMIDSMLFSQPDGERVQTSNLSDKTAKIAISYRQQMDSINREWYQHLQKQFLALSQEIRLFESAVNSLPGKMGDVAKDLFLKQMPWEKIMETYFVSRTTIARYRKQALEQLVSLYQKQEQEMLSYMLS